MEKTQSEKSNLNTELTLKLNQNKLFLLTIVNAYCVAFFNYQIKQNSPPGELIELLVQILLYLMENNPIIYRYSYEILSELYTEQAIKDLLVNNSLEFEKQLTKEKTDLELIFYNCSKPWIINLNKYVIQSKTEKKALSANDINQLYMQDLQKELASHKKILLLFSIAPPQDSSKPQSIQFLAFLSHLFKQTKDQILKCIFWNIPNSYLKQEFILAMSQPIDMSSLDQFCLDAYSFIRLNKIENKHSNEVSDLMKKTSFNTEQKTHLLDIIQASNTVREWTNNHTIIKVVEELSTQMNEHHSNHSLKQAHDQLTKLLANIKHKNRDLHSYFHRILGQIYKDESLNQDLFDIDTSDYKADTELNMAKNYCVYSMLKIIGMFYKTNDTIELSLFQLSAYIAYSDEVARVLPQIHENLFLLFLALKPESFFDDFIWYMPMMFFDKNIEKVLERLTSERRLREFIQAYFKGITPPNKNNLETFNTYYQNMRCLIQIHSLTDLDQIEHLLNKTSFIQETKKKELMEIMQQNKPNIKNGLVKLSKENIKLYNIKLERQREIEEIRQELNEKMEKQKSEFQNEMKKQKSEFQNEMKKQKRELQNEMQNEMENMKQELKEEIRQILTKNQNLWRDNKLLWQDKYCIETRDQIIRVVDFFNENSNEIHKYKDKDIDFTPIELDKIEQKQCYEEFDSICNDLQKLKIDGNHLAHPNVWSNFYEKLSLIHQNYKIPSLESIKILCNTPSFKKYFDIANSEQAEKTKPAFNLFYQEYKQCKDEGKQNIMKIIQSK